jgi:hypothetical protein
VGEKKLQSGLSPFSLGVKGLGIGGLRKGSDQFDIAKMINAMIDK